MQFLQTVSYVLYYMHRTAAKWQIGRDSLLALIIASIPPPPLLLLPALLIHPTSECPISRNVLPVSVLQSARDAPDGSEAIHSSHTHITMPCGCLRPCSFPRPPIRVRALSQSSFTKCQLLSGVSS